MRLGQKKSARTAKAHSSRWIGLLIIVFIVGLVVGDQGWYRALVANVKTRIRRSQAASAYMELPQLIVDMDFADYNTILAQRERALAVDVNITSADDFVPATIQVDDVLVPVRLRLREGLAENLGPNDKWSFEVRVRDDAHNIFGWQRLYLLDPAANNWLNQWAFTQALQREGILTARYRFVRLTFNGDNRGIYAVQEGFADALLVEQDRDPGVIVEFDANLLWESIAYFQGSPETALADPITNLSGDDFRYFEIDTFRDATIARDPELSAQKEQAIALLYALQTEQRPASEVFDIEQYGRFLALVDLWGATEGTSLINLKYYYNATTGKLEPVSFDAAALKPNALGSEDRLSLVATYDDPRLQAAYIEQATRISQPEYLENLRTALEPELQQLKRALSAEQPDLHSPWDALRARQEIIHRSLNPIRPLFAYLETNTSPPYATLRIDVGNVINLPVEIVGFDINGDTFLETDPAWISSAPAVAGAASSEVWGQQDDSVILNAFDITRSPVVRYVQFNIPLTTIHAADKEIDFNHELDILIATRILGSPNTHFVTVRTGLPEPLPAGETP